MISPLVLLAAAASMNAAGPGMDAGLAAGLEITIDRIPEPVSIDGVQVAVQRATGAGVPELARRIEASWRQQGSHVATQRQGEWTIASRFQGPRSQVLQWRAASAGQNAELLVSVLDVLRPPTAVPPAGVALPAGCVWARSIFGSSGRQSYLQRSARCPHAIEPLLLQLRQMLPAQGWRLRMVSDSGLQVGRDGAEGFLSVSARKDEKATWVTWLRLENSR